MKTSRQSERGSALMLVVIVVLILVGISMAYQSISWWNQKRAAQDEAGLQAMYIAESAANQYITWLNSPAGSANPSAMSKTFLHGGYYWVPVENIVMVGSTSSGGAGATTNTGWYSVQVAAKYNGMARRVDMLISRSSPGPFGGPLYSYNTKGGPYQMDFASGDVIRGNAYIAGDVNAQGTAQLLDETGTKGNITKYTGSNNSSLSGPNPPTFVNGKEEPLNLDPEANGKSRWENAAERSRTNNFVDPKTGTKYVDVANELTTNGKTNKWVDGSTATDILSQDNPAHIFRKDPGSTNGTADRTTQYEHLSAKSPKSSYYLEDPTSKNVTETSLNGTAHPVNGDTTASMINIKDSGNNAVYFIDGNMRVSGEPIKSYQLNPDPSSVQGPVKMTVVVKGNVSLTDNVLLPSWQSKTDGLAIVAIEDPAYPNVDGTAFAAGGGSTPLTPNGVSIDTFVKNYNNTAQTAINEGLKFQLLDLKNPADWDRAAQEYNKIYGSGNVYFGDPGSGTVEHFESFLYAQNNFYATNLDSTKGSGGTQKVEIYGTMAAGNKVLINRNTANAGYIPLNLTFDPLIKNGGNLPDLPVPKTSSALPWTIQSWTQATDSAETGGDK